jgi:hypothetical protein
MRQVSFNLYERFILTPVEIQGALKPAAVTALVLVLISGVGPGVFSFTRAWDRGMIAVLALVTGIASGAVVTPMMLPFVPFRRFALKGIVAGSLCAPLFLIPGASVINGMAGFLSLFLFSVAVSSYLAMNFTGATPFTSPSGVEQEMKEFIPVQLAGLVISSGLWIFSAF